VYVLLGYPAEKVLLERVETEIAQAA
jgi:hypothetical protein